MEIPKIPLPLGGLSRTIAAKLPPTRVYLLWNMVLILYVLWPFKVVDLDPRTLLSLPLEYVPLLLVLAAGWLSGLFRGGPILTSRPRYLALFALAVILYGALSVAWVVNHRLWLQYFTMWVAYFVFFFTMVSSLSREEPERFQRFLDQFFLLLAIYALLIVGRRIAYPPRFFPGEFAPWDFTPIIRYRISQVLTILPFIPIAIRMYLATNRPVYLVFLGVGSTDLLLSFSRVGIAGWFAVVILSFLVGRSDVLRVGNRRKLLAVFAALFVAVATTVAVAGVYWFQRVASIFFIEKIWFGNLQGPEALGRLGATGRPILLREAIRVFLEHPWVGTGVGNYLEYIHAGPVLPASPHNFFLTYLAEFGVLGFLPLMAFFLYLVYFLWNRSGKVQEVDQRFVLQGFLVANVSFLVVSLASDFMTTPYIWFFWGLSVAFALSVRAGASDSQRLDTVVARARVERQELEGDHARKTLTPEESPGVGRAEHG